MKRYWEILKKYRLTLLVSPFLVLIAVFSEVVQPYFMSQIIDDGVMVGNVALLARIGVMMVVISIAGMLANVVNARVSSQAATGFGTGLRSILFRHIQSLSFADMDTFGSASLITRLTNDITKIQQVILLSMRIMLRAPMMLIMALFFMLRINAELAVILLFAIPLLAVGAWLILKKGLPFFRKVQQRIDALNRIVRENLINIRVVKSFVREDFEAQKFALGSEALRDTVIRAANTIVSVFPLMQLILNLSIVAILWFGGIKVMNGNLKVGELISFVNYLTQVLIALMMLSMVIMTIARASASSQRIIEVLNTEPSLKERCAENSPQIERGDVCFNAVSFRYAGGETDVLHDVTFSVRAGETIAVVGATGSAKSSMVQLIPRLYDATGGEVLIDGVKVQDYSLEELHNKIGMVLQQNDLFSGTILDNLRWGDQNATREAMEAAARTAEAHDFIMSFQKDYETVLGRGGVNISGGQKQRICMARALLRSPKILILDDSTSAVDSETELRIRQNFKQLPGNMTIFIITQRINTMQSSDRIVVLDDGRIDAVGTPEEVMHSSAIYREIYRSQQFTQ